MITRKVKCPTCSNIANQCVGQQSTYKGLSWWIALSCLSCGHSEDGDDYDVPEEIRQCFIKENGLWGIKILSDDDKIIAAKHMRKILKLSLIQVSYLLKAESDAIWWEGTEAEIDWLCTFMNGANVKSAVKVRVS